MITVEKDSAADRNLLREWDFLLPEVKEEPEGKEFDVDDEFHFARYVRGKTFVRMSDALAEQGYCLMGVPPNPEAKDMALQQAGREEYVRPYKEFEEAYLGSESNSKIFWQQSAGDNMIDNEPSSGAWQHYNQFADRLTFSLATVSESAFGFSSEPGAAPKVFRRSCASSKEHANLGHRLVDAGEEAAGAEERFLDFIQRRSICIMYAISSDGNGVVELRPREEDLVAWHGTVKIPFLENQVLIFRQDLLAYTYKASDPTDLVLQTWLLQEPRSLQIDELTGSQEDVVAVLGAEGSVIAHDREVHFTGLEYRLAGNVGKYESLEGAIAVGIDAVTGIPKDRWDHDQYYHPEGHGGLALCNHGAAMSTDHMFDFDNDFFNIDVDLASRIQPVARVSLEISYSAFQNAGYNMDTLRGQPFGFWGCSSNASMTGWAIDKLTGSALDSGNTVILPSIIVSHTYGLVGPVGQIDTACSASNVATNLAYQQLRINRDALDYQRMTYENPMTGGMIYGDVFFDGPGGFIGLSQAHMVGRRGRARTYDMSADGMQRGETTACMLMEIAYGESSTFDPYCNIIAGAINQDGRSASLTAPNGPSQRKVLDQTTKDMKRPLSDTTVSELHGTGTALGDPIETGSLRSLMIGREPGSAPILHSSGKSNTNHNELAAGLSGMLRQIMSIQTATAPLNMHLYVLNSNIENDGYPAIWPTERVPVALEHIHNGVSSFGFGGTNARIELWGRCSKGTNKVIPTQRSDAGVTAFISAVTAKKKPDWDKVKSVLTTCPQCLGLMDWTSGEAYVEGSVDKPRYPRVRSEDADYSICSACYTGDYIVNRNRQTTTQVDDLSRKPYIVFGGWDSPHVEEMQENDGIYEYTLNLGEESSAQFNIMLDEDESLTLYPVLHDAPQDVKVCGPDGKADGRSWLIDTSNDDLYSGKTYRIRFQWDHDGKWVSWEALSTASQQEEEKKEGSEFSIVGSWNEWAPRDMVASLDDATIWESNFSIGESGREEFHFVCGDDVSQVIYPDGWQVEDTAVRILGPDDQGYEMSWLVTGNPFESVKVQLRVKDGHISMSAIIGGLRTKTWTNQRFFVVGAWNEWALVDQMQPTSPGLFVWRFYLESGHEDFQIVADEDWYLTLHPHKAQTMEIGKFYYAKGPDAEGRDSNWTVKGPVGAAVEVSLDMTQPDKIPVISSKLVGSPTS